MNNQEMIDEIMDSFDFYKVQQVMIALNLEWHDTGVPDTIALRKMARMLLKKAIQGKKYISCGGFSANFDEDVLELQFVIEQHVLGL